MKQIKNYKMMKDAKIKDSYYDEMEDLKDRARSMFGGDYGDLTEIVARTLDDGLIYDSTIFELASHYLRGSDILDMFYEELFDDLYSELSDEYEESLEEDEEDEEDEDIEDSKSTKDVFINDPKKKIRK